MDETKTDWFPDGMLERADAGGEVRRVRFRRLRHPDGVSVGLLGSGVRVDPGTPLADVRLDLPGLGDFLLDFEQDEIEGGWGSTSQEWGRAVWAELVRLGWKRVA